MAGFELLNNFMIYKIFGAIFSLINERRICLSTNAGMITPKKSKRSKNSLTRVRFINFDAFLHKNIPPHRYYRFLIYPMRIR
jgi:hypothetical protein